MSKNNRENNRFSISYINNPCYASSLPFWKTCSIRIPNRITIIRDDQFDNSNIIGVDEPYFKLMHNLGNLSEPSLPNEFETTDGNFETFASHINKCYEKEGITLDELKDYSKRPVYDKSLWLAIKDSSTKEVVATAIGELDPTIKEGIIEWIQVSPDYRKRGLGKYLVLKLLNLMKKKAEFVTVSGKLHSPSNPIKLYESCGFDNLVIWHVIKQENNKQI